MRIVNILSLIVLTGCQTINVSPVTSASPSPSPVTSTPSPPPTVKPIPITPASAQGVDDSCLDLVLEKWPRDASGWTIMPKASRTIYVSATADTTKTDAKKEIYYVKSYAAGIKLLRKGNADAILFHKGEAFEITESLGGQLGGKSLNESMVIGAYGSGARPILLAKSDSGLVNVLGSFSNLIIVDVNLKADRSSKKNPDGVRLTSPGGKNLLLENVKIESFNKNLAIDSQLPGFTNFVLRRSIIVDAYNIGGTDRAIGLYIDRVKGVTVEENVFDHNGYLDRKNATAENHNLYIQTLNSCFTFTNNVTMRASATGLQARPGGVVENNLFYDNPLHLTFGSVNGGSVEAQHVPFGVSGRIKGNVFIQGTDISPTNPRTGVSELGNIAHAVLEENIFAHHARGAAAGQGLNIRGRANGIGIHNLLIRNNTIFDLATPIVFEGGAWGALMTKPETFVDAKGVSHPGVSVWSIDGKTKMIAANESGLAASMAGRAVKDNGTTMDGNIFQNSTTNFQSWSSAPKPLMSLKNMQTSLVKFKDTKRMPSADWIPKVRSITRENWAGSPTQPVISSITEGFQEVK